MTDIELAPQAPARAPVDALAALRGALTTLDDRRRELVAEGDWESLAWGLDGLRTLARELAILVSDVEQDTAKLMPSRQETVEHLGTLVSRPVFGAQKWRSEELLAHLVIRAIFDPDTGELTAGTVMDAAKKVAAEFAACAPVTPSMQWRATALKERGIKPDDWRDREYRGESVQITKAS